MEDLVIPSDKIDEDQIIDQFDIFYFFFLLTA